MTKDDRNDLVSMIRDSAAAVAPRGGGLARVRALRFTNPGFDLAVLREIAQLGWIGLRLPEEHGGVGLGMIESVALYEEMGRGLVPEPLIEATLSATLLAATGEADLLARVLSGESLIATAWAGTPDAIDIAGDPTTTRHFVPMTEEADAYLLPSRIEDRVSLRLVKQGNVSLVAMALQDGGRTATLTAQPDAGRLIADDIGEAAALALDEAALGTAAYLLGVAESAFAMTIDYLKQRKQFGQALGAFQALQHRAADMKIQLALTRASIDGAAADLDRGADARSRAMAVSRAKARAADTAMLVGREAIQMHGAIGYTDEYDVGLFTRKAMVVGNQYGSPMAHRRRYEMLARDIAA